MFVNFNIGCFLVIRLFDVVLLIVWSGQIVDYCGQDFGLYVGWGDVVVIGQYYCFDECFYYVLDYEGCYVQIGWCDCGMVFFQYLVDGIEEVLVDFL